MGVEKRLSTQPIKELIINKVCYAKYQIDGDNTVFLNVQKIRLPRIGDREFEDICIELISIVEDIDFKRVGFLNI